MSAKTYVVPLSGHARGKIGYVHGSLADRQQHASAVGIFKTFVYFPNETHPRDFKTMYVDNLREATPLERQMCEDGLR